MDLERSLGRLISAGTYLAVALIGVGVAVMVVTGPSPLDASVEYSLIARSFTPCAAFTAAGSAELALLPVGVAFIKRPSITNQA